MEECEIQQLLDSQTDSSEGGGTSRSLDIKRLQVEIHFSLHIDCHITIWSSGTAGQKRALRVPAAGLWATSAIDTRELVWFASYPKGSMGFTQMQIHALKNLHGFHQDASADFNAMAITPSIFRKLAFKGEVATREVLQVTFGGENADQPLLDLAKSMFPGARISHTYASTELGLVFSSSDGHEGFPDYLLEENQRHTLRLDDNELVAEKLDGSEVRTGDMFERIGRRIKFLGRVNDSGNVAGSLVFPSLLTRAVLELESVQNARCWLEPNPITGNVIVCQLVAVGNERDISKQIVELVRARFDRPYRPGRLDFVPEILLAESGKA